jgi:hypothetical protein
MRRFLTSSLRLAGGALVAAALFGCDGAVTLPQPGADETTFNVVAERISLTEKERALRGEGDIGGRLPLVSPMNYGVESIPYQAGPRNLPNTMTPCDDCVINDVPVGFPFQFYGNTYSTLQISSNGFVRFAPPNNDSGCCSGRVIPTADLWNNIIAFGWTDLNPTTDVGGRIRYGTVGTAPNRRFILHADSVRNFGVAAGTRNLSAWLILYEGTNVIELHTEFWNPHTQAQTQGIENADGTEAHFVPGRVATTFTLTNDGVRFNPLATTIDVNLHRIYSGNPPRMGDTINLGDQWVYVEILDPLQYRPGPNRSNVQPFQSANQVRIGPSWETGVPAESFQLLDINNDGKLDFRGRWSRQALQDAGRLPVGTPTLRVWGDDNGQRYRGERQVTVVLAGQVLYDSGPWITHPGAGAGGANVHMAATNFLASNARRIGAGPHFRIADRFTVPAGGWNITTIITRALINDGPQPNWNFYSANVWNGRPGDPGSTILGSVSAGSFQWSGAYAVFLGEPLTGTNFPIFNAFWPTPGLTLPAGTYWLDWQLDGSAAWAIYTTAPNPQNPNQPILVPGVGRHLTTTGWQNLLEGEPGVPVQPGTPFVIVGTPATAGAGGGPAFEMPSVTGQPAWTPSRNEIPARTPHLRN